MVENKKQVVKVECKHCGKPAFGDKAISAKFGTCYYNAQTKQTECKDNE